MIRLARWVSIAAHPFAMLAIAVAAVTTRFGLSRELASNLCVVAAFAILPMLVLMIVQVRRGAWTNVDASNPKERPILYVVSISSIACLVIYLLIRQPDSFLLRGSAAALALLSVCAIVTRWIKVSLHITAAALTATILTLIGSEAGWIVAAVVPILAWSRYALGRHKPAELAAGFVLGVMAGIAMPFV